jgi:hypothetical protein
MPVGVAAARTAAVQLCTGVTPCLILISHHVEAPRPETVLAEVPDAPYPIVPQRLSAKLVRP